MPTAKQTAASKRNIRKAQRKWRSMSKRERAYAQPEGRNRLRPGTGGHGKFFRIEVRPNSNFVRYRVQNLGRPGHTKRLAGQRSSGSWATKSWLVAKGDAYIQNKKLIVSDPIASIISRAIRGPIRHLKGDIFVAKPRRDIPEKEKPTPAMRKAQKNNIKKAQAQWRSIHAG